MDVDAGPRVGDLGQETRQDRHLEDVQHVSDPVDRDREEAWIGGDDLVDRLGRRIAGQDRLAVLEEAGVHVGERIRERRNHSLGGRRVGERLDKPTEIAAGEDEAGGNVVGRRGRVVRQLREQDPEQAVGEGGHVALERVDAAVLGTAPGECGREGVVALVVDVDGHRSPLT